MSSAEDDVVRDCFKKILEQGAEDGWHDMENLPTHVLVDAMRADLFKLRDKPEIFERLRSMVIARPDWTEWVQWKIDWSLEQLDKRTEEASRGRHDLDELSRFLYMLGTVDAIPFYAQYLDIPYEPGGVTAGPRSSTGFQRGGAITLREFQIPGGPDSNEVHDWKEWWKKNAHLYEKGPDGKIHGPAPTRRGLMNGKIPEPLPPAPRKVYATAPPRQTPASQQSPSAASKPSTPQPAAPHVASSASGKWLLPAAIASGLGAIAVLAFLFRRRKGNSE